MHVEYVTVYVTYIHGRKLVWDVSKSFPILVWRNVTLYRDVI